MCSVFGVCRVSDLRRHERDQAGLLGRPATSPTPRLEVEVAGRRGAGAAVFVRGPEVPAADEVGPAWHEDRLPLLALSVRSMRDWMEAEQRSDEMTHYNMMPPSTEDIRAKLNRGDYGSEVTVVIRALLDRLDSAERQVAAQHDRMDDH